MRGPVYPEEMVSSWNMFVLGIQPCRSSKLTQHCNIYDPSSASNRIIHAKDHASIGLSFAELDDQGNLTGASKTINICGEIRRMGESDDSINRLSKELGLAKNL